MKSAQIKPAFHVNHTSKTLYHKQSAIIVSLSIKDHRKANFISAQHTRNLSHPIPHSNFHKRITPI